MIYRWFQQSIQAYSFDSEPLLYHASTHITFWLQSYCFCMPFLFTPICHFAKEAFFQASYKYNTAAMMDS